MSATSCFPHSSIELELASPPNKPKRIETFPPPQSIFPRWKLGAEAASPPSVSNGRRRKRPIEVQKGSKRCKHVAGNKTLSPREMTTTKGKSHKRNRLFVLLPTREGGRTDAKQPIKKVFSVFARDRVRGVMVVILRHNCF